MNRKDEFKDYLKAVIEDAERGPQGHPAREELIDYAQQSLDDRRRQEIESHVEHC